MNQKGISAILIILIIVGFLIVVGGVWYWQNQKEKSAACTQDVKLCPNGSYVPRTGPSCKFVACPEEKQNETANWQIYRNEEYEFEFKYPPYYEIYGLNRGSGKGSHKPPIIGDDNIFLINNSDEPGTYFNVYITIDPSITDWEKVWTTKDREIHYGSSGESSELFLGTTTFMGFTASLDEWCVIMNGCSTMMSVPQGKTTYQLEIASEWDTYYDDKGRVEDNIKLRNQILSTFKFIQ